MVFKNILTKLKKEKKSCHKFVVFSRHSETWQTFSVELCSWFHRVDPEQLSMRHFSFTIYAGARVDSSAICA